MRYETGQEVRYVGTDPYMIDHGPVFTVDRHWNAGWLCVLESPLSYPVADFEPIDKDLVTFETRARSESVVMKQDEMSHAVYLAQTEKNGTKMALKCVRIIEKHNTFFIGAEALRDVGRRLIEYADEAAEAAEQNSSIQRDMVQQYADGENQ